MDEPNSFQQELLQVKGVGMQEPVHEEPKSPSVCNQQTNVKHGKESTQ